MRKAAEPCWTAPCLLPEEVNPEGEADIRGEIGIEGLKSGQRARGVEIADAGANRIGEELRAERT
jgi:hypothetical protein